MSAGGPEPGPIPRGRRAWWYFLAALSWLWVRPCYRLRTAGGKGIPRGRPVLVVSNHQSFLDPILVGLMLKRPFWAIARSTLFPHPVLGWLIRSLNALPIDQHKGDRGALRAAGKILAAQETMLIFPEGVRSGDGRTGSFARGVELIIRKHRPLVVPVGIDGAFDVWPRGRPRPRLFGRIAVIAGEPVEAEALLEQAGEEKGSLPERLRARVEALRQEAATLGGAA